MAHMKGTAALGMAARDLESPRQITSMLISLGAHVKSRLVRGRDNSCIMSSPLSAACIGLNSACLDATWVLHTLLDAGADINGRCEIPGYLSVTPLIAATFLAEPDAVRVFLQQPKVDIHATGIFFSRSTSVPYATNVSAIDIARGRLWPWAHTNPNEIPVAAFDLILDMLMRKLHEECVALAQLVEDEQLGVDAGDDVNTGLHHAGNRRTLAALKGLSADTDRLQCAGKPFVRELAALGREILQVFSLCPECPE